MDGQYHKYYPDFQIGDRIIEVKSIWTAGLRDNPRWLTSLQKKAEPKGGQTFKVDPKFTSKECSCCGFTHKDNRKSQAEFQCLGCGYQSNADYNAASNILARRAGLVTMRDNEVQYK